MIYNYNTKSDIKPPGGFFMNTMIDENKVRIDKFDTDYYVRNSNFPILSAIGALRITNDIRISFLKPEEGLKKEDYALRLYALLQSLFVSIDSLYSLAYGITRSKSFININNNPDLRSLKYIRNDVVGHPSNRVLGNEDLAYCILDEDSITKERFSYFIFTKESKEEKVVDINNLIKSYYEESNDLLDTLLSLASDNISSNALEEKITKVLDGFYLYNSYVEELDDFIKEYHKSYPNSKRSQHRILWRYELVKRLGDINYKDDDMNQVIKYCLGLELNKMYELIFDLKYNITVSKKLPILISSFYRFLNKNREYVKTLPYLKSPDHPFFEKTLIRLYNAVSVKKLKPAKKYLKMIIDARDNNDLDLAYALALPIKDYKKK